MSGRAFKFIPTMNLPVRVGRCHACGSVMPEQGFDSGHDSEDYIPWDPERALPERSGNEE